MKTWVDLIRHGQPEGGDVFRGHSDHPLTPLGWQQFWGRIEKHQADWTQVVSSPLLRCQAAAQDLAQRHNLPLRLDARFKELNFGAWENQPVAEVMARQREAAQALWQDPLNFCAPDGEPVAQLRERVLSAWAQLVQEHAGQHVLLVSHGGVMRVLVQHLLGLSPEGMSRIAIPYAGFMRFSLSLNPYAAGPKHWVQLEVLDGA
jgi:alpha-ribazole phosphatase